MPKSKFHLDNIHRNSSQPTIVYKPDILQGVSNISEVRVSLPSIDVKNKAPADSKEMPSKSPKYEPPHYHKHNQKKHTHTSNTAIKEIFVH